MFIDPVLRPSSSAGTVHISSVTITVMWSSLYVLILQTSQKVGVAQEQLGAEAASKPRPNRY